MCGPPFDILRFYVFLSYLFFLHDKLNNFFLCFAQLFYSFSHVSIKKQKSLFFPKKTRSPWMSSGRSLSHFFIIISSPCHNNSSYQLLLNSTFNPMLGVIKSSVDVCHNVVGWVWTENFMACINFQLQSRFKL